jgi:hypothetical protein
MLRVNFAKIDLLAILTLSCASRRTFDVINAAQLDLSAAPLYYVVVNSATEEVDYGHLWDALDYQKYAAARDFRPGRPEVPTEIASYLERRGKRVQLGPASSAPQANAMIIVYKELWGWDMRDIIKALTIYIYPAGRLTDAVAVKFEELTIFNTQPIARSLVPQMLDTLLSSATAAHQP